MPTKSLILYHKYIFKSNQNAYKKSLPFSEICKTGRKTLFFVCLERRFWVIYRKNHPKEANYYDDLRLCPRLRERPEPCKTALNSATNRFQLNFKRNVGATSEAIRKCAPKSLEEWQDYYFKNVKSEEHIIELGKKLYIKTTEVLVAEIDEITEEDCINYIKELVIDRTYDGYVREIKTIYEYKE